MYQFLAILLLIIFVVIVAYALVQNKPAGFDFKNFFSFSSGTSTSSSGANRSAVNQPARSQSQSQLQPSVPAPTPSNVPSDQPHINLSEIPLGFTIRDLSPYFKKVGVSASPGSFGSYSQVSLYGYFNGSKPVDVTGWLLKGNRGSVYVPQAVDSYDPSGVTGESDINLKNGDVIYLYSTISAIGRNLRLNKCIGWLANTNQFSPPLSLSCPGVNRSQLINFTGQCQGYILSLASCQIPNQNLLFLKNDYECQAFLDKLNYGGCVAGHRNDYDFFSNQWLVWTGSQFLDFQHDRLLLLDKQGLLVTEYSY